ncbi:MAG TPA: glutamate decarboxylase [Acidimicrobiia bacterium]|nr:glutamate decarboxylase [Acidimicrobiia bacterium]
MSHEHRGDAASDEICVNPLFSRQSEHSIPRWKLPDHEMLPETAYQIIHDELFLDGNARQNLATFVTTWMEPEATQLYVDAFDKNMVDKDEYPQTAAIEERCLHIVADLWNAPDAHATFGTSTIGSSEACMLAGLAFKRRWQIARRAAGKPTASPNIVFSSAVQVVWEKFANYFEVEPRYVPISKEHPYLTPDGMLSVVDENTIGVVPVLGVTYNGVYEPVKKLADALDALQERTGLDVPLHVDAASGGFVAPFLDPQLEWDFRVPRVHSISASGHKFGLVYPGLGWVVWSKREYLPDELVFTVSYLGGDMPTLGLNFSRPGAQVLLQYYNFLRLGRGGYRRVMQASKNAARFLAAELAKLDQFEVLTDGSDMPLVTWTTDDRPRNWNLHDLSAKLRERGWQVPAYPMPDSIADLTVMRVVFRNGVSIDLTRLLLDDIETALKFLDALPARLPADGNPAGSFHH